VQKTIWVRFASGNPSKTQGPEKKAKNYSNLNTAVTLFFAEMVDEFSVCIFPSVSSGADLRASRDAKKVDHCHVFPHIMDCWCYNKHPRGTISWYTEQDSTIESKVEKRLTSTERLVRRISSLLCTNVQIFVECPIRG